MNSLPLCLFLAVDLYLDPSPGTCKDVTKKIKVPLYQNKVLMISKGDAVVSVLRF